ncbi:MAG: hypothetical protein HZB14_05875 [Actinobacteria bacterium]|nr:hypothetical protein [Actinomycetota bacterium]
MRRFGTTSRAKRPAPVRSSAVNQSFRGGATPAVREYLGELRGAEIRASRGDAGVRASREETEIRASRGDGRRGSARTAGTRAKRPIARTAGSRAKRPVTRPAATTRDRSAATTRDRSAATTRDRSAATRRESLRALDQNIARGRAATVRSSANRSPSLGGSPYGGRAVASAGGAAALTVGKAMVDVARPAAAVAKPVLRVVTGGLDRLPAGQGAQAAARGRILIVVAGLLAAGLIYINVGKLEAGDGYGRYAQRSLELQRENTIIRSKVAQLESSERIARLAKKLGMVMPQPEQFKYLSTRGGDPARAIRTYTAPTPVAEQPAAAQPQATPPSTVPDTGAAAPVVQQPQPTAPQVQQPVSTPGATGPGVTTPGAATPGAGTGAPAVGGN